MKDYIKTNYHVHSRFCDGRGEPEEYVQAALACGIQSMGFSGHAPIESQPDSDWLMHPDKVEEYRDTVLGLKAKYADRIQIYLGMECDYMGVPTVNHREKYRLEYTIGSVHVLRDPERDHYHSIDGSVKAFAAGIEEMGPRRLVRAFYEQSIAMIDNLKPDIAGHVDLCRRNNFDKAFFDWDEPWYKDYAMPYIEHLAETGTIVEMNVSKVRPGVEQYPSDDLLRECFRLGIPMTVDSDSHAPESIDFMHDWGIEKMRSVGYRSAMAIIDGRWQEIALE